MKLEILEREAMNCLQLEFENQMCSFLTPIYI